MSNPEIFRCRGSVRLECIDHVSITKDSPQGGIDDYIPGRQILIRLSHRRYGPGHGLPGLFTIGFNLCPEADEWLARPKLPNSAQSRDFTSFLEIREKSEGLSDIQNHLVDHFLLVLFMLVEFIFQRLQGVVNSAAELFEVILQ